MNISLKCAWLPSSLLQLKIIQNYYNKIVFRIFIAWWTSNMEVTSDFFREECMYSQMKLDSQQPVTLNFSMS